MKVLFIFEDQNFSSFFVYDLIGGSNGLLRISPEITFQKWTLGELYRQVPIETFLSYFSAAFSIEVKKYFVLKKEDFLQGVKTVGLEADGKMPIVSNKAFFALKTNQQFKKGEQRLTLAEIDAYISYQIDQDGRIDVFERQEDIIRLMKRKTVRPRLSVITNNYGTVKEYTDSNLNLKDLLKLGSGYLAKGNARMNKVDVPTAGSFTLSGDFPYQLETIDWKKNTLKLRSKLV
ncbi:hypothetical protein [Enterococcus dongliensis]|uniref:hypothetical protein n=1 Tax=Enterococcus dongliensis TaxID=2559925 RepID=UPI00288F87D0|nr:hypothetical protein [Enterococcus dongliensis]MDT2613689.1 hypothetical protein [Enterococcus dongliensis]